MRVHLLLGLALLTLPLAAPTALAGGEELVLSPDWPDSFREARQDPITLIPGPPIGESDVSTGPITPGATAADTEHTFRLAMLNPNGTPGPFGDLNLDPDRPVQLRVFLSADASHEPVRSPSPVNGSHGAAPQLTVEANLSVAGAATDAARETQTIVSSPAHDSVHAYTYELDFDREVLPAGAGFHVDVSVQQAEPRGQQLTQPLWNIHTGPQYPTGIVLPLEEGSSEHEELGLQSTQPSTEDRNATPTSAVVALAGSIFVALAAAVRGWRQL